MRTGTQPSRGLLRFGLVVIVGVALVGAACSSSKPKAAPATTTTTAESGAAPSRQAVNKGIALVFGPADGTKAGSVPAVFTNCVEAKLSAADRVRVAKVTSGNDVPNDLGIRLVRAGKTCDAAYVIASFKSELVGGSDAIPGLTDAQATCAATGMLNAVAAADDKAAGSGTDGKPLDQAMTASLDTCYPISGFIASELKQQESQITDAQISCIVGKLNPHLTWSSVIGQGSDAFDAKMQAAAAQCTTS